MWSGKRKDPTAIEIVQERTRDLRIQGIHLTFKSSQTLALNQNIVRRIEIELPLNFPGNALLLLQEPPARRARTLNA